jgi:hypothetical protein
MSISVKPEFILSQIEPEIERPQHTLMSCPICKCSNISVLGFEERSRTNIGDESRNAKFTTLSFLCSNGCSFSYVFETNKGKRGTFVELDIEAVSTNIISEDFKTVSFGNPYKRN